MAMFKNLSTKTLSQALAQAFNGPALVGIGATADKGLLNTQYHQVPFDPTKKTAVKWDGRKWVFTGSNLGVDESVRCAVKSIDDNFGWSMESANVTDATFLAGLRRDLVAILLMMVGNNLYSQECTIESNSRVSISDPVLTEADFSNQDLWSRAGTIIYACAHSKWQTNHTMGGTVPQGAIGSVIRAYYTNGTFKANDSKHSFLYKALYWALHPLNHLVIYPTLLPESRVTTAMVHTQGPAITSFGLSSFFLLRSNMTPASTHYFAVGLAALERIHSIGIAKVLPNDSINQVPTLLAGYKQAQYFGVRCHPSAQFWGYKKIDLNQKVVERLVADVGYAVRKILPADTLAGSPILVNAPSPDPKWKAFVDAANEMFNTAMEQKMKAGGLGAILPSFALSADRSVDDAFTSAITAAKAGKDMSNVKEEDVEGYWVKQMKSILGGVSTAASISEAPDSTDGTSDGDEGEGSDGDGKKKGKKGGDDGSGEGKSGGKKRDDDGDGGAGGSGTASGVQGGTGSGSGAGSSGPTGGSGAEGKGGQGGKTGGSSSKQGKGKEGKPPSADTLGAPAAEAATDPGAGLSDTSFKFGVSGTVDPPAFHGRPRSPKGKARGRSASPVRKHARKPSHGISFQSGQERVSSGAVSAPEDPDRIGGLVKAWGSLEPGAVAGPSGDAPGGGTDAAGDFGAGGSLEGSWEAALA